MDSSTSKNERLLRRFESKILEMPEGETIDHGVRVVDKSFRSAQMSGASMGTSAGISGNISGSDMMTGTEIKDANAEYHAAEIPFSPSMAFALTNNRLLVWERNKLFGYIKQYLGDIALSRIKKVHDRDERGSGWKITLTIDHDTKLHLFAKKRDKPQSFVSLLKERMGGEET